MPNRESRKPVEHEALRTLHHGLTRSASESTANRILGLCHVMLNGLETSGGGAPVTLLHLRRLLEITADAVLLGL